MEPVTLHLQMEPKKGFINRSLPNNQAHFENSASLPETSSLACGIHIADGNNQHGLFSCRPHLAG
jgi:hypothetical protein